MVVPDVLVFDVNETLSDMTPIAARFREIGLGEQAATTWFASVLRDGFAVAAADGAVPFAHVAAGNLDLMLEATGRSREQREQDVALVLSALRDLDAHPDVRPGLQALADAGHRLVTLTNGSVALSEPMFARAGVLELFEHRLSVQDAGRWKPDPAAYAYALRVCDVPAERAALVAVHPWDVHGAQQAGLGGIWVNRTGGGYPPYLPAPDVTVAAMIDLPAALAQA
jgi:2-haloacid dehalogenase